MCTGTPVSQGPHVLTGEQPLVGGGDVGGTLGSDSGGASPVSSSLLEAGICFSSRISLQSKFFRRCPSSTTRYLKLYFCKNLRSAITQGPAHVLYPVNYRSSQPLGHVNQARRVIQHASNPRLVS